MPLLLSVTAVFLLSAQDVGQSDHRGLRSSVSIRIDPASLVQALAEVQKQLGIRLAFMPEMFPPGKKIGRFTYRGTLKEGLDRLCRVNGLKWQVGELGGIVLLPSGFEVPILADWIERALPGESGVEVVQPGEKAQRLGLKQGDILIAVNGERCTGIREFYLVCREIRKDSLVRFSVKRGSKIFHVETPLINQASWASRTLGIRQYAGAPSHWTLYQKGGHRDPRWDGAVKRLFEETRKHIMERRPAAIMKAAREAVKLGCRDPLVLRLVRIHVREYGEDRWNELVTFITSEQLRKAYGGSHLFARAKLAADFALHGSASLREPLVGILECAWVAGRQTYYGDALAAVRFREGDYDSCIRLVEEARKEAGEIGLGSGAHLKLQSLIRLGRNEKAMAYFVELEPRKGQGRSGVRGPRRAGGQEHPGADTCLQSSHTHGRRRHGCHWQQRRRST